MNPSTSVDVTRLEHENLTTQVMENAAKIRWLEVEAAALRKMLERHIALKHGPGDAM